MRKLYVRVGAIFGIVLCFLAILALWAGGGIQLAKTVEGSVHDFGSGEEPEPAASNRIVVLTWNIAYGHGKGSEGRGYTVLTADGIGNHIDGIGNAIKDSGADLVLLQEIDFDSDRSYNVDQLEELSRITGLRYAAPAISWKANYVPYPYWPPVRNFGKMLSGGAVLSRYPITTNRITLHPKPDSNGWLYNLFYLFRYSQYVQIQFGEQTVGVVNNHLESYDRNNREKQAQALADMVNELADKGVEEGNVVIFGGDMNAVQPEASKFYNFSDSPGEDYSDDATISILREAHGFKDTVGEEMYLSNEQAFFTFPSDAPSRRIDYLFVSEDISVEDVDVIQTGGLSDHLPVISVLTLSD